MLKLSEPQIIERGPYKVIGAYSVYEGDNEEPSWAGAYRSFTSKRCEITNQIGDLTLGFLYRPHKDHPDIDESVKACFIGVEVSGFEQVPEGLSVTQFSGGRYVLVACIGETQEEAAIGVGEAIEFLSDRWMPENGYQEGDACLACSQEQVIKPPYVEYVYMKIE